MILARDGFVALRLATSHPSADYRLAQDILHRLASHERSLRFAEGKRKVSRMERETGFEPATSTLARSHSTTELFPLAENNPL